MHHSRYRHLAIAACVGFFLGGCEVAHNDVLVFGTQTNLGIDISASAAQGGVPNLTLGYKRYEAVWMPLVINAKDSKLVPEPATASTLGKTNAGVTVAPKAKPAALFVSATNASPSADVDQNNASPAESQKREKSIKYRGEAAGIDSGKGGAKYEIDSYSVFASFGAKAGAAGGAEGGSANVALAQFFATGIAAQRLGANTNVTKALVAEGADARVTAEAQGRANAEAARAQETARRAALVEQDLQQALGRNEYFKQLAAGNLQASDDQAKIQLLTNYVAPQGDVDAEKLEQLLDATEVDELAKTDLATSTSAEELKVKLVDNDETIEPLFRAWFEVTK